MEREGKQVRKENELSQDRGREGGKTGGKKRRKGLKERWKKELIKG